MDKLFYKDRIMTTGPTPVPNFVLTAMSDSVHYHRSPAFAEILQDCKKLLPPLFGTKGDTLIFAGTGTLAMEGAIANFFNPGDEVISINSGKFGQRWGQQAAVYGCKVHEIKVPHGEAVKVADVEKLLTEHPHARGILIHASETSTGVRHDVKAVAALAKKQKDCFTLVDAVTSGAVFNVPMDEWGVDVMVSGSQKGFMLPPGLSFAAASARAWDRCATIKNVRYYLDWRKERKALAENSGAFTSPVTLIGGLRAVLQYFHEQGLENLYERHWKLCAATRAAAKAMGYQLLVKDENSVSPVCTAILAEGAFTKGLRENFGLTVSGGQDDLKGKIVRIGHVGYMDGWDVLIQLQAFARTAKALGQKADMAAAEEAFWKVIDSKEKFART